MRNVIVSNIVTIDGFSAGEGGNPMVLNMDAAFDAYNLERMRTAGTILLGRSSYELFGSFWPAVADAPDDPSNPALSATNREFSRLYRDIPKVVVSDTLVVAGDHPWADTTEAVARSDAPARLASERAADGGDILVFASHILWNALLADGQVDELHLMVGPHALGSGVSAFVGAASLDLIDSRRFDGSGNVLHSYRPVR